MGGRVERIFLGWERPFLHSAVESWIEFVRSRGLDPQRCIVVLPGRRAARRVEERIAELAPPGWAPPRVLSEGELAGALRAQRVRTASEWQRALAWREALEGLEPQTRGHLWGGGEGLGTAGLARLCERAFAELAAEGVEPASVIAAAERSPRVGAVERWRAYAQVEARYREALARRGVVDPASGALDATGAELDGTLCVQLFAVVDPPRALRALLRRVTTLDAFVFAPASEAARFDAYGFLDGEHWSERDPGIDTARWRCVDGPDEMARQAVEWLGGIAPAPAPEELAVGLADLGVRPFLERRLIEAGCEPRWAGGSRLADTRPAQFVLSALRWCASRSVEDFGALARLGDFEALCGIAGGELAAALDTLVAEHVPARIDGHWPASPERDSVRALPVVRQAFERAQSLLGGPGADARSCAEWARTLRELLAAAYPKVPLGARDPLGWRHVRALEALARHVAELGEAERSGDTRELSAAELAELVGQHLSAVELPPHPAAGRAPMVELFGWLELALDDAPHLVLCGLNEGALPSRGASGGFLGDPARRELGLVDDRRRAARDVWALAAILAGRPHTLLLTGRRDAARNPLVPSRLLFRASPEATLERIQLAFPEHERELPPPVGAPEPYTPKVVECALPREISVTGFKAYLESPYLYYVQHVLQRHGAGAIAPELDAMSFGTLAHAVLAVLGRDDLRSCTDESRIRSALHERLDELASGRFGSSSRPAVQLQVEKLRMRLARFASWQARSAQAGWHVREVELKVEPRELDGMLVKGRIDRIDWNARTGAWRISDYKTGEKTPDPASVHGRTGEFRDLQLPLYHWLTETLHSPASAPAPGRVELGYIALSREDRDELFLPYDPGAQRLAEALDCARDVIARIQRREFAGLPDKVPFDESIAALCGFGLLGEEESEGDEEGDES